NLVSDDSNQASDIFLRELENETTQLLSQRHHALPDSMGAGMSTAIPNSISTEGRKVVFSSSDSNLVPDDMDGFPNLFVRNLLSGTTLRGTPRSSELQAPGLLNTDASISADDHYLAFGTLYSDLFVARPRGTIARFDLETGTSEPVN